MEYKEIIQSAIQALRNNLLRTSLTMLGIIIGITSVILIYSIGQGAVAFITNELSSFGTDYFQINPGNDTFSSISGSNTLTLDDVEAIKKDLSLTNIKTVAPIAVTTLLVTSSSYDIEETSTIMGTTPEIYDVVKPEMYYGEFLNEENATGSERVAVIGSELSETLFGIDTNPVGEKLRIKNSTFRVIGVAHTSSALAGSFFNSAIYVPIDVAIDNLIGREEIQEIDVSVYEPDLINQTITDVEILLRDRHDIEDGEENDFIIQSAGDIILTVQTITGLLTVLIAGISGISLVVGGVGVMNIMLVSVTERTREIGLLKAIGAKEKDILTQFLVESVVMSLIGGVIGVVLGIAGAFLISVFANIPFVISIPAIILAVGVSTLVGIVFGIYPARRAAKLSPIDALRYE